ncbi:MAG: 8-oxo-dGTP diphosphatase [Lachnospiraceae bacterium]|nr:8-oxo-dGTP diphosphatase [Lachnospiraceae bacterium]
MTTLCYIRRDDSYLMLYRNKKENDENEGKWIGIGGKIEEGESPEQCVRREVFEETGLTLLEYSFRGIVTFVNDVWENEYMVLYEAASFSGELRRECDEGELAWVPFDQIMDLPLWEGDRVFLEKLIRGDADASCRLEYHNDHLTKAT